ncbi:unnamed protein product [Cuscuta campestris]|uniref:Uncharacterized protein n=1 Tax=Cuscuta campestris TaxID=132261 RepID=A0A484K402_9ASTE|nr:unnamed protein product [Cuscuta campestris]
MRTANFFHGWLNYLAIIRYKPICLKCQTSDLTHLARKLKLRPLKGNSMARIIKALASLAYGASGDQASSQRLNEARRGEIPKARLRRSPFSPQSLPQAFA